MCGICGIIRRHGPSEDDKRLGAAVRIMRRAMAHRGPDGHGIFERDGIAIGHTRLAVIDIRDGVQPMTDPTGDVVLSYNGEVYNFLEIKPQLASAGWQFRTRSDTEVVLAAYAHLGADFDAKLNGMFAYALADFRRNQGSVQLGTDPVGIKPLYLFEGDDFFIFASELRAVISGMRAMKIGVEISSSAMRAYLTHGWVPPPLSMIGNVRRFGPGERLKIDLADGHIQELPRLLRPTAKHQINDNAEALRALESTLDDVLARQIISDVPIGFFLSGGIDSSLLMAKANASGIATESFTIRFAGEGHGVAAANEADIAQEVARLCNSNHHEITLTAADLRTAIGPAIGAMDQPLADAACLPLLLLSRFAKERVSVVLSGDGGDELFAGYPRHIIARYQRMWSTVPAWVRSSIGHVVHQISDAPASGLREVLRKAKVGFGLIDDHTYVTGPFAQYLRNDGTSAEPWNQRVEYDSRALMDADIDGQLAGQMLPKTDNMTMAASLECRVPLLDNEMIELATAMPLAMKISGSRGKQPLRNALKNYLPSSITERPKQGFRVPLTSWFRGGMADEINDKLLADIGPLNEFLPRAAIKKILDEHMTGQSEHSIRIWSMLALQGWIANLEQAEVR